MKVCLTGGAGMIGSALVKELVKRNHEVLVIDNLWRGRIQYLEEIKGFDKYKSFFNIDLSKYESSCLVVEIFKTCDAVIHLADIVAGIEYVFNNQYDIFRINNIINSNVFGACATGNVKKILYAGTACSFPKNLQMGLDSILTEDQLFPAYPESAYGWSKLLGTLELSYLKEKVHCKTTTLILHNVYGPNCDLNPVTSQVIPAIIKRMIELMPQENLCVWGSGNQGRAFTYVDDIVRAFILALEKEDLPEIIQIGPSQCTSIKDLVETLNNEVVKKNLKLYYDMSKPEGDLGRCANYNVALESLGWSPQVSLKEGLNYTYEWIKNQL